MIVIFGLSMGSGYINGLYNQGVIHINYPNREKYPIVGVDVSNHQGKIDWETLVTQDISFAFIKATEGSSYVDPWFNQNWKEAAKTGIRVGAYHFFSFDSAGEKQATLFCKNVPQVDNMLPPVVDVEYYGKYQSEEDIDIPKAKQELRILVDALETEYGMKPIIYCGFLYDAIYKDDFEDCDLWYGLIFNPTFNKEKSAFWQYSQNHILEGYSGKEKLIDMNAFMGSREEFDTYLSK
jgi:lysozyme